MPAAGARFFVGEAAVARDPVEMERSLLGLLLRWLVLALGVTLAGKIVPGVRCADGATLTVVVVLLSFFNAVLRPILLFFTLPFVLLTLGVGIVVINAFMFLLVARLVDGFEVDGFWPAFWAALIVGFTNVVLLGFTKRPPGGGQGPRGGGPRASGSFNIRIERGGRAAPDSPANSREHQPGKPPDVIDV